MARLPLLLPVAGRPGTDNHFLARVFPPRPSPNQLTPPPGIEKCRESFVKLASGSGQDAPAKWAAQEISYRLRPALLKWTKRRSLALRTIYTPIALLEARGPWSPRFGFESCSTRRANSTSEEFALCPAALLAASCGWLINGASHRPLHFRVRALYSNPTLTLGGRR